jgi:hypothetical protein
MPSIGYWLTTAGESALGFFGIRTPYEQPDYRVAAHLANAVEIRDYAARTVIETPIERGRDDQAFGRLFAYITGANTPAKAIAMTIPVERATGGTLRFFLPKSVVAAGAPAPKDPSVHIVDLPPGTIAARRFTGTLSPDAIAAQDRLLRAALAGSDWHAVGATARFGYDPPFTPPFLRRNEVTVAVEPTAPPPVAPEQQGGHDNGR